MTSISNFISRVKNENFVRENRFEVLISPPVSLQMSTNERDKITFFCQSATMPGVNFLSQSVYTFGESREVVYNRNFEPVQLEFVMDGAMNLRWFFDRWTTSIIDPITRIQSYYRDYVGTVDISQLTHGEDEEAVYTVRLHEAFPKSIDATQYTSSSKEFVKLRVTLQYKYWTVVKSPRVIVQSERDTPTGVSRESPM